MFPKALVVLALLALAVGVYARASGGAGRPQIYRVKPADTLWAIAASHYGGDTRAAVWKVEQRNGLRNAMLVPGQRLVLP